MSAQTQMFDAKQRVQKALQTFPTDRAVQLKDKTFYEHILLQVRAVLAQKESQSTDDQELLNIRVDIGALEKVVGIKGEYIAFLDEHMNAFQEGLASGAKSTEGKAMHWDAVDLIKYVNDDEKVYLERVKGFKAMWEAAIEMVNPAWVKAFGEMYVETGKKEDAELAARMAQLNTSTAEKKEVEKEQMESQKELETEQEKAPKKGGGRLKGKARKEAKKASAAKK